MQRTIISLSEQDHAWLDYQAKIQHLSKAEVVRRAIGAYRKKISTHKKLDLAHTLEKTQGIVKLKEGLQYQRELRDEWEK